MSAFSSAAGFSIATFNHYILLTSGGVISLIAALLVAGMVLKVSETEEGAELVITIFSLFMLIVAYLILMGILTQSWNYN